ncbi:MAG TPA: hypothetical protein VKD90_13390 [Gemmataceae bacterium]|nr:hypothetical protein [Gemmataceae bacterium]
MSRTVAVLLALAIPLLTSAAPRLRTPDPNLPVGKWRVHFDNGVVERCEIRMNGTASVVEPLRSSPGKWSVKDGSVVIVSDDDRLERWTHVEGQWVVEHWCPVAAFPEGAAAARGTAKRER